MKKALSVAAVLMVSACAAAKPAAPASGNSRGRVPDLLGTTVMVMPVQGKRGVTGEPTAEVVDALKGRGQGVRWLMPDTLRLALQHSPGLNVPLDALPVAVFLRVQVNRLGDPMFGYLRRLSALTGAGLALIPVEARRREASGSLPAVDEIVAAVVDAQSGRVVWFGVVEGEPGDASSPRALASAADALARTLLPDR